MWIRARILVQVTIYRRLRIGRDGHLDQSEAYDISQLLREYGQSGYSLTRYDISHASDWSRWPPRPIWSLRYIATCTRIRTERVFSYTLRYIVGFGLVEVATSTNPKPTIYRNLYENTDRAGILLHVTIYRMLRIGRGRSLRYIATCTRIRADGIVKASYPHIRHMIGRDGIISYRACYL